LGATLHEDLRRRAQQRAAKNQGDGPPTGFFLQFHLTRLGSS
jgi:hypothetical protein